jgi:hypothetical protein
MKLRDESEDQPFVEVVKVNAGAGLSHVDEDVLNRIFVLKERKDKNMIIVLPNPN